MPALCLLGHANTEVKVGPCSEDFDSCICTSCHFVVGTSTIAVLRDEQHGCVMRRQTNSMTCAALLHKFSPSTVDVIYLQYLVSHVARLTGKYVIMQLMPGSNHGGLLPNNVSSVPGPLYQKAGSIRSRCL